MEALQLIVFAIGTERDSGSKKSVDGPPKHFDTGRLLRNDEQPYVFPIFERAYELMNNLST